ncbi:MAG: hypothetical protein EHM32_00395, partial [Spirochaetales bacterium]
MEKKTVRVPRTHKHKALRIGVVALLGGALLLGALFFSLRNVVLRRVLDSRIRAYQATHSGDVLRIGSARFSGLADIDLENIQLHAAAKDLTATVKKCFIQIHVLKMLSGRVRLKRLALSDLNLDLSRESAPGFLPARPAANSALLTPRIPTASDP